ncbi:hypothetical protein ADIMK_1985 [Marinobacterium lacunae]|uniref:Uncharacterized protein n=1 Tax=Marinobacterium lacunae TaxID=1232683 RepID=A0A081FZA3_9GAMM|nr:hypothetical protein ADIMK_1985 [Marinobacterium lacunae]
MHEIPHKYIAAFIATCDRACDSPVSTHIDAYPILAKPDIRLTEPEIVKRKIVRQSRVLVKR